MVARVTRSWSFAFATLIAVMLWWSLYIFPPASYWYNPQSMVVGRSSPDGPVILFVEEEIKRPVVADWRVVLRRKESTGWQTVCVANGRREYTPRSEMPDPLTLSWWTDGKCTATTPGSYFITTHWSFETTLLPGQRKTRPLVSNVFDVEGENE